MKIKRVLLLIVSILLIMGLVACEKDEKTKQDASIADMYTAVIEKSAVPSDSLSKIESKDDLELSYMILPEDVKEFAASRAINYTESIYEFVIVEAADKDAAERVRECLQRRLDDQTTLCNSYSPEFVAILEKCKVEVNGNFVSMFICDNSSDVREEYSSFFN